MRHRYDPLWLVVALLAELALLAVDLAAGDAFLVRGLYLLPVLAIALRAHVADVVLVGVVGTGILAASVLWNDIDGDEYLIPLVVTAAGSAIAAWGAREREMARRATDAVETERRQMQLLADAAQITDGAAHIDEALRRLVDLLVPAIADAAWVDVVGPDGRTNRIAARVHGPAAEVLETWLMARGSAARRDISPTTRVLRGEGSQIAELTPELREGMIHDEDDRRLMDLSRLRYTMVLPLAPSGGPLGALGVAVGESGRRYDEDDLAFARLLVGRAGLALANAQLVNRLTATQRRLDGILGALAEAVTVNDARGRMAYANQAAAELMRMPDVAALLTARREDLVGRFDIRRPDGRPVGLDELPGTLVLRGQPAEPTLVRAVYRATGEVHWLLVKATPLVDETGDRLAVNVIEDVTEEHEAALRERFLAEAGQALASSLAYEETLQRVVALAVPDFADWCAIALPDDRGTLQQVALAHVDPARAEPGPALLGTRAVMHGGLPRLMADVTQEHLADADDGEQRRRLRTLGARSAIVAPMLSGGRPFGAVTYVYADSGRRYGARDLPFAMELATRAATAIENARLYTQLADVADTLQASLLPEELPEVDGWRFAADYRPGERGSEVGGDFYDVFEVEGGHLVLLGDVTGKGVTAASLTALVRYTARTAASFDPCPTRVLAHVNHALRQRPRLSPVTMVCALLEEDRLTVAVGGHPLPLLKPGTGASCERVGAVGMLLGVVHDYEGAQDVTVTLAPGDAVVLYTDGVPDTPGADGRFGDERLAAAVDAAPPGAEAVLRAVSAAVDDYASGTGLDDRAMLVLERV